jgi:hypothetical protein
MAGKYCLSNAKMLNIKEYIEIVGSNETKKMKKHLPLRTEKSSLVSKQRIRTRPTIEIPIVKHRR